MHIKRITIPKNWPVPRKGTKYIVRPLSNLKNGIPILIILRDILKIVRNRKEAKRAIHLREIILNGKVIKNEKQPVLLFDVIKIPKLNKIYRVSISKKGKFYLYEITEKESNIKISKIINKNTLKGGRTQLNLSDGTNFISDISCKTNDSVVVDIINKKIKECLPLKVNSKVFVFLGKYAGISGIIKKIYEDKKMVEIESENNRINVLIEQLMVVK
ncbi:MAG: 30S ribosomal protein S4e [Candidatus Pacearchaeota archaeon]